jgi:hypothetical protein
MVKYVNLNPTSQEASIFLHLPFISESAPDIQKKAPKNLKKAPRPPKQILINTAFKDFNNKDEKAKQLRDKNTHTKYQMLAYILQNQNQTHHTAPKIPPKGPGKHPSEACFLCRNKGHWVKSCPNPHPPKPCPQYGQWGHWRMDCPQGKHLFPHIQLQIPKPPQRRIQYQCFH